MTKLYKAWLAVLLLVLTACGTAPTTPTRTGQTVTGPGTPVGAPVTQTIGPAGGTMQTADGKIQITFPAGAVASDTLFTLQPLTHALPNGVGLAYELSPQTVKLEKPIEVRLLVSAGDQAGASASMGLAVQDDSGAWFALKEAQQVQTATVRAAQDAIDRRLNAILRSLIRERQLIKAIGAYADLRLVPSDASVRKGGSITLHVHTCEFEFDPGQLLWPLHCGPPGRNADQLNATAGQLSQTSPGELRYTAPGAIPNPNPVALSVTYEAVAGRAKVILVGSVWLVVERYSGQFSFSYTMAEVHKLEGQGNITLELVESSPEAQTYIITGGSFEFTYTIIAHGVTCQPQRLTSPAVSGGVALELVQGSTLGKTYSFFPVSEGREGTLQCRDGDRSFPWPFVIAVGFVSAPQTYTDETVLEATNTPLVGFRGAASWRLVGE